MVPAAGAGATLPIDAEWLAARHLLVVDAEVEVSDVIALVSNLFPRLAEPVPVGAPRAAGGSAVLRFRLSRHSALIGPIWLPAAERAALGLPDWADVVFALDCPRDREDAPPPDWYADAEGLERHFPAGLPDREEGRMLASLIALARRLHAALRLADEDGAHARIITPDPESRIDIFVHSPYWLAPDVLLGRLRSIEPALRHPDPPTPEQEARIAELTAAGLIDPDEPVILDGYGLHLDLSELGAQAGHLEIRVAVETALPPIVAQHLGETAVQYHLAWMDAESKRYDPQPGAWFANLRRAAALRLEALAAEVISATAGIAVDEDGFLVTAQQLRS